MKTETAGLYRFDLPEGAVYVTVVKAQLSDRQFRGYEFRTDERVTPEIRVHTTPDPSVTEDAPGFVKVRGRRYLIDVNLKPVTDGLRRTDGTRVRWTRNFDNEGSRRGFRNDQLKSLDFHTVTSRVLDGMSERVADMMDAEHPEWRIDSVRARLESECANEARKITEARKAIADHEDRMRALMARIESLTA